MMFVYSIVCTGGITLILHTEIVLRNYILQAQQAGLSLNEIFFKLISAGWKKN